MFGTVFGMLLAAHFFADFYVQTDYQAQRKGLRGKHANEGRWNCFKHAASYTAVQAATLPLALSLDGVAVDYPVTLVFLALNGVTHYVIDRRWTLEAFARALGKGEWIDNDKTALMHLDQAAHITILGIVAVLITAAHA